MGRRVNKKCEFIIKMHSLIRGQGRETSQRVFKNLQKTQKMCCNLLTNPRKYDIITISLIIDPLLTFALRFRTYVSLWHFTFALYGAERPLQAILCLIWRVLAWFLGQCTNITKQSGLPDERNPAKTC